MKKDTTKRYEVRIKHPSLTDYSHEVQASTAAEAARMAALACRQLYGWPRVEVLAVAEAA